MSQHRREEAKSRTSHTGQAGRMSRHGGSPPSILRWNRPKASWRNDRTKPGTETLDYGDCGRRCRRAVEDGCKVPATTIRLSHRAFPWKFDCRTTVSEAPNRSDPHTGAHWPERRPKHVPAGQPRRRPSARVCAEIPRQRLPLAGRKHKGHHTVSVDHQNVPMHSFQNTASAAPSDEFGRADL